MKKLLLSLSFIGISALGIAHAQEKLDASAIEKFRELGLNESKVMKTAMYLTDVSGPRLANSPGLKRAQEWAAKELTSYGLSNVNIEPWGDFGRGWEVEKSYIALKTPYYSPIIAVPKAWSSSTNGFVSGEILILSASNEDELNQYKGKLAGKIVMANNDSPIPQSFEADQRRYTEEELKEMAAFDPAAQAAQRGPLGPGDISPAQRDSLMSARQAMRAFAQRFSQFLQEEGVALVLNRGRGAHGTVFTSNGDPYAIDAPTTAPSFEVSPEDYLRILRLKKEGIPVTIEAELKTRYITNDIKGYNVVAELPGSDPELKDEVVMLGGHLDSWHGSTGATDNAAGCAAMIEAIRILKESGLKPKRTIRIALWSSEEQGLHGSRNYVANHFGNARTQELKPEQEKVSAYYNLDNGGGKIRGIYTQMNEQVAPIFEEYLKPFADLEATTVTLRNTGGTDHQSFDAIGIPGFQFIQDPLSYNTRTHHTNQDSFDRLIEDDLKQAATIIASFVYHTAQRPDKLPRKPLVAPSNSRF